MIYYFLTEEGGKAKRSLYILIAITLIAGLVAGAAAGYYLSNKKANQLKSRLAEAEKELLSLQGRVEDLERELEEAQASAEVTTQTETTKTSSESTKAAGGSSTPAPSRKVRQFCYIKQAKENLGKFYLVVDYAQFLTGAEAARAAAAHGDESPPPNDFYIVNDNPQLRTHEVDRRKVKVLLVTKGDGTQNTSGGGVTPYEIDFEMWFDWFIGMSGGTDIIKDVPYWITLDGGKVIKIEEQYLP